MVFNVLKFYIDVHEGAKTIQPGKYSPFNKWCCKKWIFTSKKLDTYLTPFANINSKWTKDLET